MPHRPATHLSRSKYRERVLGAMAVYPLYRFFGDPRWAWRASWQHMRKLDWIKTLP